jgi:hypothetical protein
MEVKRHDQRRASGREQNFDGIDQAILGIGTRALPNNGKIGAARLRCQSSGQIGLDGAPAQDDAERLRPGLEGMPDPGDLPMDAPDRRCVSPRRGGAVACRRRCRLDRGSRKATSRWAEYRSAIEPASVTAASTDRMPSITMTRSLIGMLLPSCRRLSRVSLIDR